MSKFSNMLAQQQVAAENQAENQAEAERRQNLISNASPDEMVSVAEEIAKDREWLLDKDTFVEFMAKGGRHLSRQYHDEYVAGRERMLELRTEVRMIDIRSAAKARNWSKVSGVLHGLSFDYRFNAFGFASVMNQVLDIMSNHPEFEIRRDLDEKMSKVWLDSLGKRARAVKTAELRKEQAEEFQALSSFEGSVQEEAEAIADFGEKYSFTRLLVPRQGNQHFSVLGLFVQESTSKENDAMLRTLLVAVRMGLTKEKKSVKGSPHAEHVESSLEYIQHLLDYYEMRRKASQRGARQNKEVGAQQGYRGKGSVSHSSRKGAGKGGHAPEPKKAPPKVVVVRDGGGGNATITSGNGEFPLLAPNHGDAPGGRKKVVAGTGKKGSSKEGKGKSSK